MGPATAQPILNLSGVVCSAGEMGLLGLAVDPAFSANRFIYLYYTHKKGSGDARRPIARTGSLASLSTATVPVGGESVLIDNIAAPGSNHNAGDLQFDRNGLLYISVGDGGSTPDTARRLNTLNGKILRIDRNGGIPADNPVQGPGTERCAATGGTQAKSRRQLPAKGREEKEEESEARRSTKGATSKKHRSTTQAASAGRTGRIGSGTRTYRQDRPELPRDLCDRTAQPVPDRVRFERLTGPQQFFINDVGGGAWEEIDAGAPRGRLRLASSRGTMVQGSTTNCSQTLGLSSRSMPIATTTGCRTITGGAFVPCEFELARHIEGRLPVCRFGLRQDLVSATSHWYRGNVCYRVQMGAIHLSIRTRRTHLYYTTFEGDGQVREIVRRPETSPMRWQNGLDSVGSRR